MLLETERLIITEFEMDMAEDVHLNSLDEDTRRFVPDEVFETIEDAQETVEYLMEQYGSTEGPLVYPMITKDGDLNVGYVQLVPFEDGEWEVGYHVAKKYTNNGYATEAVNAFLPFMCDSIGIEKVFGICLKDNVASIRVLEKCGFKPVCIGMGEYQKEEREIYEAVWNK